MLRRCGRLSACVSEHHPSYTATPRGVSCLFTARLEVLKCNKEIARLMGVRDQLFESKFHVARHGNGWFKEGLRTRSEINNDVQDLQRRKMLLLDYIKRNQALNEQAQAEQAAAQ
eukprot:TRINITY_DN7784_c0_g1_i1.p2 TRINITY_DN7784_c0_g1~~TRINITY_DN7784_c0_g1_i1.p2  ORF type:complete len:115 (+),score=39.44 TRINITY_DN7784_c0_g1_i1:73-417(+)